MHSVPPGFHSLDPADTDPHPERETREGHSAQTIQVLREAGTVKRMREPRSGISGARR